VDRESLGGTRESSSSEKLQNGIAIEVVDSVSPRSEYNFGEIREATHYSTNVIFVDVNEMFRDQFDAGVFNVGDPGGQQRYH
jgi:hypothetical protein